MSARIDSLDLIEARLWQELQLASRDAGHDWHTLALATLGDDRAEARTVVLRDADAAARRLVFYTDARSPKAAQIAQRPLGTLLAWSRSLSWQLRLAVRLQVQTSGLDVSSRWARLKLTPAAQDYLAPLPPGSRLASRAEPERASRSHFAVVTAEVHSIDWLELHAEGHRRAWFGSGGSSWLQP